MYKIYPGTLECRPALPWSVSSPIFPVCKKRGGVRPVAGNHKHLFKSLIADPTTLEMSYEDDDDI